MYLEPSSAFQADISGGSIGSVAYFNEDSTNPDRNLSGFVSGGSFSSEVPAAYLKPGYTLEDNGNGTYSPVPPSPVAQVGETKYNSLQEAINNANGGTVVLLRSIELSEGVTVPAGASVTLELNGNTITGVPAAASAYAVINNNGSLTINATGGGAIVCNHTLAGSTAYAVNTITNCGALTINGGTIQNTSTASNQIGYAIDNNSTVRNAVLTVNGGSITVSGSSYYDGIRLFCNNTSLENSVTVTGGSVSSIWLQNPSDGDGVNNAKDVKGSVSISGGSVNGLYLEPSSAFQANISGGSIGSVAYFNEDSTNPDRNLSGFVSGGSFSSVIPSAFLKPGYTLEQNPDGSYSPVSMNEAKIGNTTYATFAEALANAPENSTIVLMKDVVYVDNLVIERNINIDPNGHSFTLAEGKVISVAEGKVLTINLDYDTYGAAFKALAPGLCVSEGSIKIQHHAVGTSGSAATCTSGPICGFCGEEFGASLGHALVYTGSGNSITESCENGCSHSATVKLELDSSVSTAYTGSEIKALKVTYSEKWMAEKNLTVSYKDNIAIGKATGSIEKVNKDDSKATATAQFDITRATYSLTVNNYRYVRGSGYPLSFTSNVPYSADNTVTKLLIYRANGTPVMEVPAAHFVLSANSSGMTVITLSPTVMNALDSLNYELYASFTNGDAKGAFRVLLPLIFPMTGDDAQTLLLLCLTFVALGTAGVTLFIIRRKSKGNRYNGRH